MEINRFLTCRSSITIQNKIGWLFFECSRHKLRPLNNHIILNNASYFVFQDMTQHESGVFTVCDLSSVNFSDGFLSDNGNVIGNLFFVEFQPWVEDQNDCVGVGQIFDYVCNVSALSNNKREGVDTSIEFNLCDAPIHDNGHLPRLNFLVREAFSLSNNCNRSTA